MTIERMVDAKSKLDTVSRAVMETLRAQGEQAAPELRALLVAYDNTMAELRVSVAEVTNGNV